ncbi:MAG: hypothetical protein WB493_05550 [Anaeromyxobacteraceae bacterium]
MRTTLALAAAVAVAALLHPNGAFAQASSLGARPMEMKPTATPGKASASQAMKVTATVYAIDVPSRVLTLQHDMGGIETLKVGDAVRNLDQFAPGDSVVVAFDQGLVLEFQPAGAEFVAPEATAIPVPDDKARNSVASGAQQMRTTVTVAAIDAKRRVVTLQAPTGRVYKVKAGPGVKLDRLAVGDRLLATYTESVAIRLEKPKAK